MRFIRKSLRAKFTLILLFIGILPLAGASAFFYSSAKDALFKNVYKELKWNVGEISDIVEGYFAQTGKDLLTASRNAAFSMYYLDPRNRAYWLKEQHKSLAFLRRLYPGMLDEACFIDATGQEIAGIVFDEISHEHDLSSEEDRSEFFREAIKLPDGEVYQGRPVISEDTKRWVLPNATPVVVDGRTVAILHFEVTMTHFQSLLKKLVNPDRGFAFILDNEGRTLAHTLLKMDETGRLPEAVDPETPEGLKAVYARMMNGESGIENFVQGGKEHYIIFKPINTAAVAGRNDNRWALAYVVQSEKIYLELDILRYNMVAMVMIFALVAALSYVAGNYVTRPIKKLADATNSVAAGEMRSIEVDREDELGALSRSFNTMVESIRRRDEALNALAITDGLTGLYNHRFFKSELERELKSAIRFGRPLSLIIADVDYFKHYNDKNGHAQGDFALKKVAEVLMRNTREVDLAARYGGEEFVVILPETCLDAAVMVAERIRRKVEEVDIPYEELQPGGMLTLSLGVASFPDDREGHDETQDLVEAADRALYRAKENGRNQVWPSARA